MRQSETTQHIVENLVRQSEFYAEVINHANADVRKCCVFCLVEIYAVLSPHSEDVFQSVFLDKLNPSQQKLVDIYIKRKIDQKNQMYQQKTQQ